jgi:GNAT superfamily N-acetyltransferase
VAVGFVRPARPADAAEIARIQVATWRTAYRRLFPRQVLDALDEPEIAANWRDAIVAPPTEWHRVLVAVEQATESSYVVGFIAFGPGELIELLVEPRWGRRGHGSRMLAAAVDHWRDSGTSSALFWVLDQDPATRKFLTSAGWAPDGETRALDVDDMLVPQSRFATTLPPLDR